MVSRTQRTPFGEWWWTVDKLTLAAIGALMLAGVVLSLAASRRSPARLGLEPFFFVNRHILYLLVSIAVMLGVSFLTPRQIRRLAHRRVRGQRDLGGADAVCSDAEIKGAQRWLIIVRHEHPAVRIPEARFRHSGRLAVRRDRPARRHAGQRDRARFAARRWWRCWCCSPTSARPCWSRWCGARCSSWPACG